MVKSLNPAPAVYAAPAPATEVVAPAPAVSAAPAPGVVHIVPEPAVAYAAQAPVVERYSSSSRVRRASASDGAHRVSAGSERGIST